MQISNNPFLKLFIRELEVSIVISNLTPPLERFFLKDNKVAFIRIESRHFGDVPTEVEVRLSVEDSPNSAGVVIDAIRCAKLALNNNIGGSLIEPSSYFMKSPIKQFTDNIARQNLEEFIKSNS